MDILYNYVSWKWNNKRVFYHMWWLCKKTLQNIGKKYSKYSEKSENKILKWQFFTWGIISENIKESYKNALRCMLSVKNQSCANTEKEKLCHKFRIRRLKLKSMQYWQNWMLLECCSNNFLKNPFSFFFFKKKIKNILHLKRSAP